MSTSGVPKPTAAFPMLRQPSPRDEAIGRGDVETTLVSNLTTTAAGPVVGGLGRSTYSTGAAAQGCVAVDAIAIATLPGRGPTATCAPCGRTGRCSTAAAAATLAANAANIPLLLRGGPVPVCCSIRARAAPGWVHGLG